MKKIELLKLIHSQDTKFEELKALVEYQDRRIKILEVLLTPIPEYQTLVVKHQVGKSLRTI